MTEAVTPQTANELLTFRLEDEFYALEIRKVREVLWFQGLTNVPRTPDYMRGVINLRGSVVPVVDLKAKFGLGQTQQTVDSCIIIAEVDIDGEITILGALADSVEEVCEIADHDIRPRPRMGTHLSTEFIKGMGKLADGWVIILDIDRVISAEEIALVAVSEDRPSVEREVEEMAPDAGSQAESGAA